MFGRSPLLMDISQSLDNSKATMLSRMLYTYRLLYAASISFKLEIATQSMSKTIFFVGGMCIVHKALLRCRKSGSSVIEI